MSFHSTFPSPSGNMALMAPEVKTARPGLLRSVHFAACDAWAMGSLAYQIFGMPNPFIRTGKFNFDPYLPTVPTFVVRETDVSRHNGGTSGAPLKPLRDDSALRGLSSLRGQLLRSVHFAACDAWAMGSLAYQVFGQANPFIRTGGHLVIFNGQPGIIHVYV